MGMKREAVQRGRVPVLATNSTTGSSQQHEIYRRNSHRKIVQNTSDESKKIANNYATNFNSYSFGNERGTSSSSSNFANLATAVRNYQNHYQNYFSSKVDQRNSGGQLEGALSKSAKNTGLIKTVDTPNIVKLSVGVLIDLVSWSNSIQYFKKMSLTTQINLLTGSWCELFIITLAKSDFSLSDYIGSLKTSESAERIGSFSNFQKVIDQIRQLNLTNEEYSYLRAIVLFETSK
jgi:hypothetical protein